MTRKALPPERRAEMQAQRSREVQAIIARMEGERAALEVQLTAGVAPADQARIETEILHLALALSDLRGGHYADGQSACASRAIRRVSSSSTSPSACTMWSSHSLS